MPKISVLVIHNRYQQPGGEDAVVRNEVLMLRRAGHRVLEYRRDNAEIAGYSLLRQVALPLRTTWNPATSRELGALLRRERPDVAHIHNFFPLISPAAHFACQAAGVPVVQTLHNYRLSCPAATLFRLGQRCHQCSRTLGAAVRHGCYRNSRLKTAAVSLMLGVHRRLKTWELYINAYITPSRFCRDHLADIGLPTDKVHVVANSLPRDPGQRSKAEDYALFVGRLAPEKGVLEMARAWNQLRDIPLRIAGDGPLLPELRQLATGRNITLTGQLGAEETLRSIKRARFLVFPSRWDEPFGLGLVEAAGCGVPAIASRAGAVPEIVRDRKTGLLFDPDNFDEMAEQVRWAWSHAGEMNQMGRAARQEYLGKFTPEKHYEALMRVCHSVLN